MGRSRSNLAANHVDTCNRAARSRIPPLPPWGGHARINNPSLVSRYFLDLDPHSGVNQWVANTRWGRPGFEPETTGLKVHWELNGHGTFQHPPSPILARLKPF